MGEDVNVARIREVYALFMRGEVPGALDLIHPEIEIDERSALPEGRLYQGHEGVRTWLSEVAERWSELRLSLHDLRPNGDRVLAVVTISAQGAATGAAVQSESSHV